MHHSFALSLVILVAISCLAQTGLAGSNPVVADRNDASWADWEAQARMTDGDFDGAVQAAQQADTDRRRADQQELLTRLSK